MTKDDFFINKTKMTQKEDKEKIQTTLNSMVEELEQKFPSMEIDLSFLYDIEMIQFLIKDDSLRSIMADAYPKAMGEYFAMLMIEKISDEDGYTICQNYHFGKERVPPPDQKNKNPRPEVQDLAQKYADTIKASGFRHFKDNKNKYVSSIIFKEKQAIPVLDNNTISDLKKQVMENIQIYYELSKKFADQNQSV
jgi:hypothetical protein